jgi:hypothetical protein
MFVTEEAFVVSQIRELSGLVLLGLRGSRASAPIDSARRDNKETVAETVSCPRPFERMDSGVERQKYFKAALAAERARFFSCW